MISNVHGRFQSWTGSFDLDRSDPTRSRVGVTIAAASIDTHEAQRDAHLRSAEFLHVEAFPTIAFESMLVERRTLDDYVVKGDLTIRGTTQPVVLDVRQSEIIVDQRGKRRVGFEVAGAISRKDFGLTWNFVLETGGVMVGDRVAITAEIELVEMPESRHVPTAELASAG